VVCACVCVCVCVCVSVCVCKIKLNYKGTRILILTIERINQSMNRRRRIKSKNCAPRSLCNHIFKFYFAIPGKPFILKSSGFKSLNGAETPGT